MTIPKPEVRSWFGGIVASLIVSVIGGGASMYVSYRVIDHRVTSIELRQRLAEEGIANLLSRIEANERTMLVVTTELRGDIKEIRADIKHINASLARLERALERGTK